MDRLAASLDATVSDRAGKVKAAMYEAAAIIEDFKMQAVGRLMGAWDLWNLAIIPSLLNSCGIWTEISEETISKLDDIQNAYINDDFLAKKVHDEQIRQGWRGLAELRK